VGALLLSHTIGTVLGSIPSVYVVFRLRACLVITVIDAFAVHTCKLPDIFTDAIKTHMTY